jgi:triacylglycerol lipase
MEPMTTWPELLQPGRATDFFSRRMLPALATLAAARRAPRAVYSFGSPRVGNGAFVASLGNARVYRMVDGSDPVTRVPAEALGYRHAGELHALRAPSVGLPLNLLAWVRRLTGPAQPFADHAPVNYGDRLPT